MVDANKGSWKLEPEKFRLIAAVRPVEEEALRSFLMDAQPRMPNHATANRISDAQSPAASPVAPDNGGSISFNEKFDVTASGKDTSKYVASVIGSGNKEKHEWNSNTILTTNSGPGENGALFGSVSSSREAGTNTTSMDYKDGTGTPQLHGTKQSGWGTPMTLTDKDGHAIASVDTTFDRQGEGHVVVTETLWTPDRTNKLGQMILDRQFGGTAGLDEKITFKQPSDL